MAFIWLVGLKQGCMQNFSFLGDVLVFFHYYSGRPAGRRLEKAKIRLSLSPARLSLGLAELGNKNDISILRYDHIYNLSVTVHNKSN